MSRTPALAAKWTCDDCGVRASRIDGEAVPLPDSWAISAEGSFCLVCRRARAAEAALAASPSDSPATRAKLRRAALIEFEVSRTPDQPDGTIARACRTSVAVVTQARRRLCLPDPATRPRPAPSRPAAASRDR